MPICIFSYLWRFLEAPCYLFSCHALPLEKALSREKRRSFCTTIMIANYDDESSAEGSDDEVVVGLIIQATEIAAMNI